MNILTLTNFSAIKNDTTLVTVDNFVVDQGQKVLLIGANGSGKSSLLFAMLSYPGYSHTGTMYFESEDISNNTTEEKGARGIFFVPQDIPDIGGLTLLQMLFGLYTKKGEHSKSIIEYKTYVEELIAPYGISKELLLKHIGSSVSGGEKKQMELIALIVLCPKLALLDEIDSGVDFETVQKIYTTVNALAKTGMSFIIVSHNLHEVEKIESEHIYICKDGVIVRTQGTDILNTIKKNGY
ncbi:MAG: Iron-sulfur cluster assembly ATPase protein SufC [Candidatus Parcubacteria bacterium]|jgi:Fe-S cluster assembly ATP-binding protein